MYNISYIATDIWRFHSQDAEEKAGELDLEAAAEAHYKSSIAQKFQLGAFANVGKGGNGKRRGGGGGQKSSTNPNGGAGGASGVSEDKQEDATVAASSIVTSGASSNSSGGGGSVGGSDGGRPAGVGAGNPIAPVALAAPSWAAQKCPLAPYFGARGASSGSDLSSISNRGGAGSSRLLLMSDVASAMSRCSYARSMHGNMKRPRVSGLRSLSAWRLGVAGQQQLQQQPKQQGDA